MVLCNPRDKEAAYRAEMEGIATYELGRVTCRKCLDLVTKEVRLENKKRPSDLEGSRLDNE